MAFQARMYTDDENETVTIRLVGDLDSGSAGRLNELIAEASAHPVRRLVLLMERLNYLSSAGLRCMVYAHQKLGQSTEIVLVGTRPEVADTIRLTGLDHSVVMQETQESADV
jgi:anti-sigma B factor antagonist